MADDFTDADGTALEDHVAADGGTWTRHPGSQAGSATIDGNGVHNTDDLTLHAYWHSFAPVSADYRVEADVVLPTPAAGSGVAGVVARLDEAAITGYVVVYVAGAGAWVLGRLVGIGKSIIAIGPRLPQALAPGQAYRIAVEASGTTITGSVDGGPFATGIDASYAAPGRAGLYVKGAATAEAGLRLDAFAVDG